ncbi:MAG: ATP-binding cassette domain-containing protein [Leadbetterella sp.]|nr:ATP-binding cassette domain-containing protein [Leadbetterella sp.]
MAIGLENVSVKKNDNLILKNITFRDNGTGNWVITGPNGSGKSTFLDLLAGKIFPSGGKMDKDKAKSIVSVSRDYSFHRIVGSAYQYYQQRYNAYDSETGPTLYEVLQNQVLPIGTVDPASADLPPLAYSPEKVEEVAARFRVDHLLHRKVTSLSNGETRRSLLTYWFLREPDIILLDNPFSGLDKQSREELKGIIGGMSGIRVFLVADPKDIPANFTQALRFREGELVFKGPVKDLPEEGRPEIRDLDLKLNRINTLHTGQAPGFQTALKLAGVRVNYGDREVLHDITWEVQKGECWAVLGPNGSGKSTLMSLLTGDNPQSYRNEIYLFDRRRGTGESIWDIKKQIGYVSPELHLFFHKRTPVWKVAGSGFFDTMGLFRKLNEEQLTLMESYLQLFGIVHLREKRLDQLSSGQQRIVLLIRALVKNPPLLVLDEPCQGLDHNQMVFFRETLNSIVKSQQKTLIYITHYMEEIPDCVNRRLYLDEGRVVKVESIM